MSADLMPTSSTDGARVLVAIVHNHGTIQREVCRSLMSLGWGNRIARVKADYGIAAIDCAWFTAMPRVDALRNVALEQAMRDGYTHVLFLDADMLHPDDLFGQILRYVDQPIVVSGFYTARRYPYAPIALRDGQPHASGKFIVYRHDDDYKDVDHDGLRDEEVVGMGCCLIPLSIVRALGPRPWFAYKDDEHDWPLVTEDVIFCERVRAAGFRVCLAPAIQCGHLYTEFATEAHWQRAREILAHTQATMSEAMQVSVVGADGEDVISRWQE